jgi:hypothetical protein
MEMDSLLGQNEKRPLFTKGLIVGIVIGVIAIAAFVGVLLLRPSTEDQKAAVLTDAVREGSPEFEELVNDFVFNDKDSIESPNAFGTISMFIVGEVKNKGSRVFNGLEVNVAVVDQKNQVLKEKNVIVVPSRERSELGPGEIIPLRTALEGFDKKADRANIRWKVVAIRVAGN